ncbi:hypothetical protein MNBD_NITROSPINAE04-2170 [hydrothermal vent metagenome]|uniref:Uroporphyrinogen decarboxylase (URO-D) domain-containing protein n=1 Tax=hydrothermal vent metagenome TaxID=652676 RepID=A0A3B1BUZ9_9ZZZZ
MSSNSITPRTRVLKCIRGEQVDRPPVFSGMGNIIKPALDKYGIKFSEVHRDPELMAKAAVAMYREYGFECAVIPFDFAVEAEALGSKPNFYDGEDQVLYPTIKEKAIKDVGELVIPDDLANAARIPVVTEAIKIARAALGDEVAIGTYILGPFTLAGQLKELDDLLEESFTEPEKTNELLEKLSDIIIDIFNLYRDAGADYFTLREMGATSDVLSPKSFNSLVKPHLLKIIDKMPRPNILHICGNTNYIVGDMAKCGADAISVDHKNELLVSREKIGPDVVMFSGFDPIKVLHQGKLEDVRPEALKMREGASAVWPGCDIWPEVTEENMRELVDALKS